MRTLKFLFLVPFLVLSADIHSAEEGTGDPRKEAPRWVIPGAKKQPRQWVIPGRNKEPHAVALPVRTVVVGRSSVSSLPERIDPVGHSQSQGPGFCRRTLSRLKIFSAGLVAGGALSLGLTSKRLPLPISDEFQKPSRSFAQEAAKVKVNSLDSEKSMTVTLQKKPYTYHLRDLAKTFKWDHVIPVEEIPTNEWVLSDDSHFLGFVRHSSGGSDQAEAWTFLDPNRKLEGRVERVIDGSNTILFLLDSDGNLVSEAHLRTDTDSLMNAKWLVFDSSLKPTLTGQPREIDRQPVSRIAAALIAGDPEDSARLSTKLPRGVDAHLGLIMALVTNETVDQKKP